jgi:hypothetical protein
MKVAFSIFAFTALTISISLAACGGGGKSTPTAALPGSAPATTTTTVATVSLKEQITKLEDSGALPKLDRSSSITGPDVNNNGVRDDIEAYIAALQLTELQKKAAMQKAKSLQMTLTVDLTDKAAVQKVGEIMMASTACLSRVDKLNSDFRNMTAKIEGMTANTKERVKQYIQFNTASSGSVTSWPNGDTCEK